MQGRWRRADPEPEPSKRERERRAVALEEREGAAGVCVCVCEGRWHVSHIYLFLGSSKTYPVYLIFVEFVLCLLESTTLSRTKAVYSYMEYCVYKGERAGGIETLYRRRRRSSLGSSRVATRSTIGNAHHFLFTDFRGIVRGIVYYHCTDMYNNT